MYIYIYTYRARDPGPGPAYRESLILPIRQIATCKHNVFCYSFMCSLEILWICVQAPSIHEASKGNHILALAMSLHCVVGK